MLKDILPLIPSHHLYNEPFAGGAALLFAKKPAAINVINDLNGELINFYKTVVTDFTALKKEIETTLHSREQLKVAKFIYDNPLYFSNIKRAWAVWTMSKLCFSGDFTGSFSFSRTGKNPKLSKIRNSKREFVEDLKTLLENCTIEHDDAFNIIRNYDSADTFHYLAPPYVNCNMGHYENMFSEKNLIELLELLKTVKGKFMLTMYPDERIRLYAGENNWAIHSIKRDVSASHTKRRKQEEWMVVNYEIPE